MNFDLIDSLRNAAAFPHAVDELRIVETHISWVILTGQYAYKIKKPVDFGFVNFSDLARRKYFCEEEVRLNRRTAPDLYLAVVPIGETGQGARVGVEPALEYAVRMRQFSPEAELDHLLEAGQLDARDMLETGRTVARFHLSLPPVSVQNPAAHADRVRSHAMDNFELIRATLKNEAERFELAQLEAWTSTQLESQTAVYTGRSEQGFVREGHGDLHLANIVRLDGRIIPFDCLEFDPDLRRLDVINDAAFLAMDLMAHHREDLAFTYLNSYLEHTGDYDGLSVLRFYLVYRCLVRAKVASLRRSARASRESFNIEIEYARYMGLAARLAAGPGQERPRLVITHGFSGSGKTWASAKLVPELPAIRVRSDLERKRLHGLPAGARSDSGIGSGMYDAAATGRTYDRLLELCETGLSAGFNMIADATFLRSAQRRRFFELAEQLQADVAILDCAAPLATLRERLSQRTVVLDSVSEAGLEVLEYQLLHHDPLTDAEKSLVL